VVVDEIDIEGSSLLEAEDDPPVARDGDAPEPRQIADEGMQPPAGIERHLPWLPDPVQDRQDTPDLVGTLRRHPAPVTVLPQPPQTLVPEAADSHGMM
jgi:hypothetical protein